MVLGHGMLEHLVCTQGLEVGSGRGGRHRITWYPYSNPKAQKPLIFDVIHSVASEAPIA